MRAFALILVALVTLLPLRAALDVGFLADDFNVGAVLGEKQRFDRATVFRLLHPPAHEKDTRFRPATYLSLLLDIQFFGLDPRLLHLSGLLLHLVAAALVYYLARLLVPERRALAWIAGLLFALHPAQADAIGWLAARADPLLGAAVLGTVAAYARHRRSGGTGAAIACLGCYLIALLSKEPAVITPAWLVLLELGFRSDRRGRFTAGSPAAALTAIGLLTAAYFGYRYHLFGRFLGEYGAKDADAWSITASGVRIATQHLLMPTPGRILEPLQLVAPLAAGALGAGALVVGAVGTRGNAWPRLRAPAWALALLLAAAAAAALPIVPFLGKAWGRHFYLPLAPLALAFAGALDAAIASRPKALRVVGAAWAIGSIVIAGVSVRVLLQQYVDAGRITGGIRRDLVRLVDAHPNVRTFVVTDLPVRWGRAPLFHSGVEAMTRPPFIDPAAPVIAHRVGAPRDLRWDAFMLPRKPMAFLRVRIPPAAPGLEPVSPIVAESPPRHVATGYRLATPENGDRRRLSPDLAFHFEVPAAGAWPRPIRIVFRTEAGAAPFILDAENLEEVETDRPGVRGLIWRPAQGVRGGLPPGIFRNPPAGTIEFRWWIEEADLDANEIRNVPSSSAFRLSLTGA